MDELEHISDNAIAVYTKELEAQGFSKQEIAEKLQSVNFFFQWAYGKDLIDYRKYQYFKDEIAAYVSHSAHLADNSNLNRLNAYQFAPSTPNSVRGSPVVTQAHPQYSDTHISSEKPLSEARTFIKNHLDSLIGRFSPISRSQTSLNSPKAPTVGHDRPYVGPSEVWPQPSSSSVSSSGTTGNSLILLQPHMLIVTIMTLSIFSILSVGIYDRFFKEAQSSFAYPSAPTSPSTRFLSFQGRLTDSLGNPIVAATNMRFRLYTASSGGSTLYDSGTCSISPDQDGIHNVLIGSACGSGIASSVFTENTQVWLGVTVGSDSEMTPRQQIANVPYAMNAETLQGLPAGTTSSTVPYINTDGDLLIAASTPSVASTFDSQTFALTSANAITVQSAGTGDVTLTATGSGTIKFATGGSQHGLITNTGLFGFGTTGPDAKLDVLRTSGEQLRLTYTDGSVYSGFTTNSGGDLTIATTGGDYAFSDGSNNLIQIKDQGVYPYLNIAGKTDTGDPGSCSEGDIYYNDTDDTIKICHESNTWEALDGGTGSSPWTDSGTTSYLTDTTDEVVIGGSSPLSSAKLSLDGDADQIQMLIQGHSTQNASLAVFEQSDGTDVLTISNAGDLVLNGNTTLGNASGDTVTSNAAAWTFANDTTVALSGGVNGLNFDSNTLSIDATNNKIGLGTAAPDGKLHVTGASIGKALTIFNETGDQDIIAASASGNTRFRVANDGTIYGGYLLDISNTAYGIDPAGTSNFGGYSLKVTGGALLAYDTGSVGIGVTSPTGKLQVVGDESRFGDAGSVDFASGDGDVYIEDALEVDGTLYTGSIDTTFTAGSVVFAGTSGVLGEDNTNFFWDDSSNELGLGDTSPDAFLDVTGTTEQLRLSYETGDTNYASFTLGSSGDLTIAPSGGDTQIAGTLLSYRDTFTTFPADAPSAFGNGADLVYDGRKYIYATRGGGTTDFWRYDINTNTWSALTSISGAVNSGGSLVYTGSNTIYALRGNGTTDFYKYTISTDTWSSLTATSTTVSTGSELVYGGGDYIYATRGFNGSGFYRYSISGNSWTTMQSGGGNTKGGSDLVYTGGDYLYKLAGESTSFNRYNLSTDSWESLTAFPSSGGGGGFLVFSEGDYIYGASGSSSTNFYRYSIKENAWQTVTSLPNAAATEGSGVYVQGHGIYFLNGNSTDDFDLYYGFAQGGPSFASTNTYPWIHNNTNNYLKTSTDDVIIGGTSPLSSGKLSIDGDDDQIQLIIQGNATQTSSLAVFEMSDETDLLTISNSGDLAIEGTLSDISGNLAIADSVDVTGNIDASGTLTAGTANAFTVDASGNITTSGTTGLTFSSTGGIVLAGGTLSDGTDGVDIADDLEIAGGTTLGDALGDTVTAYAAAWTFANDTTIALTGGVNGINFDSDTLSIDATNNRIGIGDASPDAFLDITGTTEQLRLSYETGDTNYASFTLSSGGDLTIAPSGGDLAITGNLSLTGTFDANGQADIGDGGDAVTVNGTSVTIQNTGAGNDITLNAVDQIILTDFTGGGSGCSALETDGSGNLTCGSDAGGSTAWDDIVDPDAAASIAFAEYAQTMDWDLASDVAKNALALTFTNDVAGSNTQNLLYLDNLNDGGSNGVTESLLVIDNSDTNEAVTDGIIFVNAGGGFTDFIDTPSSVFKVDGSGNITSGGTTGLTFSSTGGIVLAGGTITDGTDGVDIADDLEISGGTTLGDASGDTVTSNAAAWTFANDTTVALSGGTNGLNFDSNTLSIDATNNRIGIGTAAPEGKLHVTGGIGKALAIFNETGNQNVLVASVSGATAFVISSTSDISRGDGHGTVGLPEQGSMAPNASFEIQSDNVGLPDGWAVQGGTPVTTSDSAHGAVAIHLATPPTDEIISTCFPIAGDGARTYIMSGWFKTNTGTSGTIRAGIYTYTSRSNCESKTSGTQLQIVSATSLTTTYTTRNGNAAPASGAKWGRAYVLNNDSGFDQLYADGIKLVQNGNTSGLDLAETYPANPADKLQPGHIVTFNSNGTRQKGADVADVKKSNSAYDKNAFGVIATQPGLILDDTNENYDRVQVALKGRVPVLVTTENGPIRVGDPITASSIPGVGMRATTSGRIIGYAMTEWKSSDPRAIDQVIVFVNPETYVDLSILTDIQKSTKKLVTDTAKRVKTELVEAQKLVAVSITATQATIDNLIVDRFIAQEATLTQAQIDKLNAQAIKAQEIEAQKVKTEKLTTKDLATDTLAANDASISGTLVADTLDSRNLREMREHLEKVSKDQTDQTINSDQLSADIKEVQKYIAQLTQEESPDNISDPETYQVVDDSVSLDPGTSKTLLGTEYSNVVLDRLMVTGHTSMVSLTVADAFSAGDVFIQGQSILSLGNELKLAALEKVDIMNGAVTITADGTITAKGEIIAEKGVRTNTLRPLTEDDDLSVKLDNLRSFNIQGSNGSKVAGIDSYGSATFTDLSLDSYDEATNSAVVIAAHDNYRQTGIYAPAIKTNAAASGNGILPAGENDIIIFNDKISPQSVINITATSTTQNRPMYVDKVEPCSDETDQICRPYFRVAIDNDIPTDATFNWLIVN